MRLRPWDLPGKSTGVGCHFLLQRIFPTQGSNLGLQHCRQMLYLLSHQLLKDTIMFSSDQFSSVVQSSPTLWDPWTGACQASLSITNSQSSLRLMSIESVMPSNHLILFPFSSRPQSFPALGSFQMSQFFTSGGQSIGVSASATVLPMNIQDWFLLGWTA